VLGAESAPLSARPELLVSTSSANAPSPDCIIKGNVNRDGKRLYHLPGQVNYAQIKIGIGEKRWFCTPEEAEAAGWRRAVR